MFYLWENPYFKKYSTKQLETHKCYSYVSMHFCLILNQIKTININNKNPKIFLLYIYSKTLSSSLKAC